MPLVKDEVKELDAGPSDDNDKMGAEVLQRKGEDLLIKRLDKTEPPVTGKPKVISREGRVIEPEDDNSRIIEK